MPWWLSAELFCYFLDRVTDDIAVCNVVIVRLFRNNRISCFFTFRPEIALSVLGDGVYSIFWVLLSWFLFLICARTSFVWFSALLRNYENVLVCFDSDVCGHLENVQIMFRALKHYKCFIPVCTMKQTSSKHQANVFKIHVHDVWSDCFIFARRLLDVCFVV